MRLSDPQRFARLFRGYTRQYGRYDITHQKDTGKMAGNARTVHNEVTEDDYNAHVAGDYGIGIIPLTDDDQVHFCAVDIDEYGKPEGWHFELAKRVVEYPIVVTKSKSGGCHLWMFSASGISARSAVAFLKELSAVLGYAGSEIFPKQVERSGPDDVGNWINLPYFGDTRRMVSVAKNSAGAPLLGPDTFDKFLTLSEAVANTVTEEWLVDNSNALRAERADADVGEDWYDGPPCLQRLFVGDEHRRKKLQQRLAKKSISQVRYDALVQEECEPKLIEGGRNIAFFNAAQYLFRKYGEGSLEKVKDILHHVNVKSSINSPAKEIDIATKQGGKEYRYQCNQAPLSSYCNRSLCLKRAYGIGKKSIDLDIEINNFSVIKTDPPIYVFNVDGARVRLPAEKLLHQRSFRAAILKATNKVLFTHSEAKFEELMKGWLANVDEIEPPPDADMRSIVKRALSTFIDEKTNKSSTDEPYHRGKVLIRDDGEEAWFDLKYFHRFLRRENERLDRQTLSSILTDLRCSYKRGGTTIAGKSCKPWIAYPKDLMDD